MSRRVLNAALAAIFLPIAAAAQIWREPFQASRQIEIVEAKGSPVELDRGTLAWPLSTDVVGVTADVRARASTVPVERIVIRLAAGPFEDRMATCRFESVTRSDDSRVPPAPLAGSEWQQVSFRRMADDPPLRVMALRRETRVLVTIERVEARGQVVFQNLDSRERLWEALTGRTLSNQIQR
jgi:hypothetical protein